MKQRIFLLTLLFLLILTRTNDISAKENKNSTKDMFTNVEKHLKKTKRSNLSYTQLVKQLIHGNVKGVLHTIKAKMKEVF